MGVAQVAQNTFCSLFLAKLCWFTQHGSKYVLERRDGNQLRSKDRGNGGMGGVSLTAERA